jgi:hypothetical protein
MYLNYPYQIDMGFIVTCYVTVLDDSELKDISDYSLLLINCRANDFECSIFSSDINTDL